MKKERFFRIGFVVVIFLGLLLRLLPVWDNNFYFTMDQGNDAVHVREVLSRHQFLIRGPETGIAGLFTGPLWYYFIALGFFLFRGHPFGSVFMLIFLNVALTGILMWILAKKVSPVVALITGASLQFFWPFYESSRYGFNPFPLVFLSFLAILFLVEFFEGKKKYFVLAAIPVGLAFHAEIAFSIALLIFYLIVGLWSLWRSRLTSLRFILSILVLSLFFLPHLVSEVQSGFTQWQILLKELSEKGGVFSQTQLAFISDKFLSLIGQAVIPQNRLLGLLFFSFSVFVFLRQSRNKVNSWVKNFLLLTLALVVISWLWFASNKGWQDWQTIALPSLTFVALILVLQSLPKRIGFFILFLVMVSQLVFFRQNYAHYFRPFDDPSLLKNELEAVDWVYKKADGQGFTVYSYLPSVYDYPYQYLFWWRGRDKYGYLPCEYASYPGAPSLFVPGKRHYNEPKKECTGLRFLIIESDKNTIIQSQWLKGVNEGTELLKETKIGSIRIQKRVYSHRE